MKNAMNEWTFPASIEYQDVPEFLRRFEATAVAGTFVFDLRETQEAHSSFIGFLIFAKYVIEKNGHSLVLNLSPALERLLKMLRVFEYFMSRNLYVARQKTA